MAVKVSTSNTNGFSNNQNLFKDVFGMSIESFCKSNIVHSKLSTREISNDIVFRVEKQTSTKDRLLENLPLAQKNLYISPLKRSVVVSRVGNVSRTTKGGRRRQVSAHGIEVGHGSWISYTAKVKAKSTQRFMAFEKISCPETSKMQRAKLLEMMRSPKQDYMGSFNSNSHKKKLHRLSSNFEQRLSAANITFFDKNLEVNLPTKPMITCAKGTKTMVGFGSYRCDNKAEPIQYSILSLLGVKNSFVKNHGSKNGIIRVSNMIANLKNIYPTTDRVRMYGVDPLRTSHNS